MQETKFTEFHLFTNKFTDVIIQIILFAYRTPSKFKLFRVFYQCKPLKWLYPHNINRRIFLSVHAYKQVNNTSISTEIFCWSNQEIYNYMYVHNRLFNVNFHLTNKIFRFEFKINSFL
jgi:hypothetical protein